MQTRRQTIPSGINLGFIDSITVLSGILLIFFVALYVMMQLKEFEESWEQLKSTLDENELYKNELILSEGGLKVNIAEKILFTHNSADITADGKHYINTLITLIDSCMKDREIAQTMRLVIGGYADTTGLPYLTITQRQAYNLALSHRRANNVASYIRSIHPSVNMDAIGYGETTENRDIDKNRKITLVIQSIAVDILDPERTHRQEKPKAFRYISDEEYDRMKKIRVGSL